MLVSLTGRERSTVQYEALLAAAGLALTAVRTAPDQTTYAALGDRTLEPTGEWAMLEARHAVAV